MVVSNMRACVRKLPLVLVAMILATEGQALLAQFEPLPRRDNASMMNLVRPVTEKLPAL